MALAVASATTACVARAAAGCVIRLVIAPAIVQKIIGDDDGDEEERAGDGRQRKAGGQPGTPAQVCVHCRERIRAKLIVVDEAGGDQADDAVGEGSGGRSLSDADTAASSHSNSADVSLVSTAGVADAGPGAGARDGAAELAGRAEGAGGGVAVHGAPSSSPSLDAALRDAERERQSSAWLAEALASEAKARQDAQKRLEAARAELARVREVLEVLEMHSPGLSPSLSLSRYDNGAFSPRDGVDEKVVLSPSAEESDEPLASRATALFDNAVYSAAATPRTGRGQEGTPRAAVSPAREARDFTVVADAHHSSSAEESCVRIVHDTGVYSITAPLPPPAYYYDSPPRDSSARAPSSPARRAMASVERNIAAANLGKSPRRRVASPRRAAKKATDSPRRQGERRQGSPREVRSFPASHPLPPQTSSGDSAEEQGSTGVTTPPQPAAKQPTVEEQLVHHLQQRFSPPSRTQAARHARQPVRRPVLN